MYKPAHRFICWPAILQGSCRVNTHTYCTAGAGGNTRGCHHRPGYCVGGGTEAGGQGCAHCVARGGLPAQVHLLRTRTHAAADASVLTQQWAALAGGSALQCPSKVIIWKGIDTFPRCRRLYLHVKHRGQNEPGGGSAAAGEMTD